MDDDTTDAAWDQQQQEETHRREQELLARAPAQTQELHECMFAMDASFRAMNYAIDKILRG